MRAQAWWSKDHGSWIVGYWNSSRPGAADSYHTVASAAAANKEADAYNRQQAKAEKAQAKARANPPKPPSKATLTRRANEQRKFGRADALHNKSPALMTEPYLEGFALGRGEKARLAGRQPYPQDFEDAWYMKGFTGAK